jgi:ribonuclease Z
MKLTIHGYSTALFATWYFIEELGILFDAGDGLTSGLLSKCGKIKNIFISHADRDHLTGLLQYNQLFSVHQPKIYYPKDAQSFPFLNQFFTNFDPHAKGTTWQAIDKHQIIEVKEKISVEAIENEHVETINGMIKSLSYKIWETKKKLKPEFNTLEPTQLRTLRQEKGDGFVLEELRTNILSYSGDTPLMDYKRYDNSKILIHEATFLTKVETNTKAEKNSHSSLEEVMKMVSDCTIDQLILGHFSSRYHTEEIDLKIKELVKQFNIKIPVFRLPIGKVSKDILNGNPIN